MRISTILTGLALAVTTLACPGVTDSIEKRNDCLKCYWETKELCTSHVPRIKCLRKACATLANCAGCHPCDHLQSGEDVPEDIIERAIATTLEVSKRQQDINGSHLCAECHTKTVKKCGGPEHTVECVKESCSINPECKGCYWCEKVKAPRVLTALEQAQLKAHMKHKAPVLNSTSLSEPAVEKREDTEDPPDKDDDLESEDSDCSDEDGDVPVPLNKDARPNPQCFECNRQLGERCGGRFNEKKQCWRDQCKRTKACTRKSCCSRFQSAKWPERCKKDCFPELEKKCPNPKDTKCWRDECRKRQDNGCRGCCRLKGILTAEDSDDALPENSSQALKARDMGVDTPKSSEGPMEDNMPEASTARMDPRCQKCYYRLNEKCGGWSLEKPKCWRQKCPMFQLCPRKCCSGIGGKSQAEAAPLEVRGSKLESTQEAQEISVEASTNIDPRCQVCYYKLKDECGGWSLEEPKCWRKKCPASNVCPRECCEGVAGKRQVQAAPLEIRDSDASHEHAVEMAQLQGCARCATKLRERCVGSKDWKACWKANCRKVKECKGCCGGSPTAETLETRDSDDATEIKSRQAPAQLHGCARCATKLRERCVGSKDWMACWRANCSKIGECRGCCGKSASAEALETRSPPPTMDPCQPCVAKLRQNCRGGTIKQQKACRRAHCPHIRVCRGCCGRYSSADVFENQEDNAAPGSEIQASVERRTELKDPSECGACHYETLAMCRKVLPRIPCLQRACRELKNCWGCFPCGRVSPSAEIQDEQSEIVERGIDAPSERKTNVPEPCLACEWLVRKRCHGLTNKKCVKDMCSKEKYCNYEQCPVCTKPAPEPRAIVNPIEGTTRVPQPCLACEWKIKQTCNGFENKGCLKNVCLNEKYCNIEKCPICKYAQKPPVDRPPPPETPSKRDTNIPDPCLMCKEKIKGTCGSYSNRLCWAAVCKTEEYCKVDECTICKHVHERTPERRDELAPEQKPDAASEPAPEEGKDKVPVACMVCEWSIKRTCSGFSDKECVKKTCAAEHFCNIETCAVCQA